MKYRAQFLGAPAFFSDDQEIPFPFTKARILALLLVEEGAMHRDRISSLLWGDKTTEAARRNLSNALSSIRNLTPIFISSGRSIGLDPKIKVIRDVDLLRELEGLAWEEMERLFRPYLDLPELDDWPVFDEWLQERREAYRKILVEGLKNRAGIELNKGTREGLDDGVRCFEKLAELEPYDEDINGELTRLYIKADRKIDAVRLARTFSRRVEEDLGIAHGHEEALSEASVVPPRVRGSVFRKPLAEDNPLLRNADVLKLLDFFCCPDCETQSLCGFVWGEEGIGKGALLAEVTNRLAKSGWHCLHVRCYQEEMARPMAPFLHLLRRLDSPLPPEQQGLSPTELSYFRVAELVLDHLLPPEGEPPRLLVIENIQWMDNASWMILEAILWNEAPSRKLLISGYEEVRPTFMLRTEIAGEPIETLELRLERFNLEQTAQICRRLRPELSWSEQRVAEVFSQTQGNPFFISQLLASGRSEEAQDARHPALPNLFTARIELLEERERLFLEGLAVLPVPATLSQITALLDLKPLEVASLLERIHLQGLIREHGGEEGEVFYYFTHPKVTEALLDGLSPTKRSALLGRAASVLEDQAGRGLQGRPHFASLAALCREGEFHDREIRWRLEELKLHFKVSHEVFPSLSDQELALCVPVAEDTGYTDYAIAEIRALLDKQIRRQGRTPERSALERDLLVLEGGFFWWSGRYDDADLSLREAYRRARCSGPEAQVEALLQLCYLAIQTDDVSRLLPASHGMYRLAMENHLYVSLGGAMRFMAIGRIMEGRLEAADKLLKMSRKVFEKLEEQGPAYTLPLIAAEHFQGDLAMARDDVEGALSLYRRCVQMGESLGIHRGMGLSLAKAGYCLCLLERYDEAEELLRRLEAFYLLLNSERDGGLQGGGIAFSLMGLVAGLKGDWEKSRDHFALAKRLVTQTRRPTWTAIFCWAKAELACKGRSIPEDFAASVLAEGEACYRQQYGQMGARVGWIH
ncbi:MAG: AAA family ATPase [Synergistaceae bacterium]|nr:AAA family ATPase [Synergistaceae bacterium]